MAKEKYCWQVDFLPEPTPCFSEAGSIVCESDGCSVSDRIEQLNIVVTLEWIELLCHSKCRISSLSVENNEYLLRVR